MKKYLLPIAFLFLVNLAFGQIKFENKIVEVDFTSKEDPFITKNTSETDSLVQSSPPGAFGNFNNRIYLEKNGLETFRENLDDLLGRIVYMDEQSAEIGLLKFSSDSAASKIFVPKDGLLKSERINSTKGTNIGLFVNVELKEEEMLEYTFDDVNRAILPPSGIDQTRLTEFVQNMYTNHNPEQDYKNHSAHIIMGVTVSEIKYRKYTKSSKKLNADNIPKISSIFSFDNYFYTTYDLFERRFIIGLSLVNLEKAYNELRW